MPEPTIRPEQTPMPEPTVPKGLLQIYTGNGKGKSTAALGQAIRAIGHGKRVLIIHFMKGWPGYGEIAAAKNIEGLTIKQFGREDYFDPDHPEEIDLQKAKEAMALARSALLSDEVEYDMIALDELCLAVAWKLLTLEDVLALLEKRNPELEVIITGREAPKELLDIADLITEMKEVRHHFNSGVEGRAGVEF